MLSGPTVVAGRYRLLERLGAGGAASVYRADDLRLGRHVAVKVLHPGLAEDDAVVERFRREARSAASLSHRHIVAIYDHGECEDTHYIAMEYIAGRTLKSVISDEGPLEPARAIDLTVQILRAARAIHERGIIHRDLKPHNAIVDWAGGVLKIIDFGIARVGDPGLTELGSVFGSVHYLSPEQADGALLTAASDLYSVGVILYEALAGRLPFSGETPMAVALQHIRDRPTPPTAFNCAVTRELESTVMRALEKDPADRFTDAEAFIGALTETNVAPPGRVIRLEPRVGGGNREARHPLRRVAA